MTKEVTKKGSTEIVDVGMFDGQDSGFEGTDAGTFKTPFLKILQALSPELQKDDSKHIPGAEQGDYCNSATQDLYKNLNVIVLKVEHILVVWQPERGGFVGRYPRSMENDIVATREGMKKWDANMNSVVDTIELYCVNADDPSDIFIFPLSKASIKHAKSFATRLRLLKANGKPVNVSWAGVWNISTVKESNKEGTWYTIGSTPSFERFITLEEKESIVTPAKEMLKTAETDYSVIDGESSTEDSVAY